MKLFFITSKLNFETAGGSVEEFDLMMRTWQEMGVDVTAVTTYSDSNRITHTLPYPLKEERMKGGNLIDIQRGIFNILKKYEHEADMYHVDGQMFMYGAGLYRLLGGKVPVQAYFNRELVCWEPMLSTLFPDAHSHESLVEKVKRGIWWIATRVIGMPMANGIDTRIYVCPQFKKKYESFGMSSKGMIVVDPVEKNPIMQQCSITETSYRERNKTSGPYTIFYSGRMVPGKGYDVLLSGFARVRNKQDFKLILGGTGPEEQSVRNMIKRYGLEPFVELPGWVEMDEVFRRYKEADLFIQPDWIPYGTSISLIKGMIFGLPCIVPAGGGLEWLAGPAAITFKRRDAESLARAIERLGADRELRATLSRGCYERLNSFDLDYKARLKDVYEEMKRLQKLKHTKTQTHK